MESLDERYHTDDEALLSFGDDTIAAINQLEISRLVTVLSQSDNANLKRSPLIVSPENRFDKSSVAPIVNSPTNELSSSKSALELCSLQKCDLTVWGLPEPVLYQYAAHGIQTMFSWQMECLNDAEVLEGKNLVYSAPTSAGKTLVAELLIIKAVLEKKKKAIIILPFVSVVREKMFYFKNLLETSGVRVEGLMGGHNVQGGIKNVDIAVCTIEKANGLINRMLEDESLHHIGIVVIDELHLLGDPFRGYLLELLITKIRYMSVMNDYINIQLVGMSATLPNLDALATWLDARLYKTDFRPIPLHEYLKVDLTVYNKNLEVKHTMDLKYNIQDDPDHVVHLCLETILNGHSVLIFCPTKNWCEKLAISIAKEFYNIGCRECDFGLKLRAQLKSEPIAEALDLLKACPVGLDNALGKSIAFGVAFHHAGLTIDERDIIEGLFRSGVIRVLTATSTLSSGVNLPARRVLIRTPVFHRKPLDIQVYKQMVGRAGRMGKDTEGESYLLCSKTDQKIGEQLIKNDLKPIASCLGHGELSSSLKRAILEVIASGVAETPEQVKCYTKCTLLATSYISLENPIESCIKFLLENEFIRVQLSENNVTKYVPTPLGNACLAASMSPDDGLELFQELQKARQCFVLENELHLIYLVTPYSVSAQWASLDWLQIMTLWEKLAPSMRRVGNLVGIDDAFMIRAVRGTVNLQNYKQLHKLSIHRRFYTALALQELVNEVPLVEVATKYQCSKGMLQSLQQTSATFAGMVTAFCKRLGWRNLELLVSQFQDRLQFGVHRELCELMHLDLLNGPRARALFNIGITSLGDLASANICQVENALYKSVTFQTTKEMEGETSYDAACRNQLKTIWITGREGLSAREAAALLIKEARTWLQQELGLVDVKWGNDQDETNPKSESISEMKELDSLTYNNDAICSEIKNYDNNCFKISETNKESVCENEDDNKVFGINLEGEVPQEAHKEIKERSILNKSAFDSSFEHVMKLSHCLLDHSDKTNLNKLEDKEKCTQNNDTVKKSQAFQCDSEVSLPKSPKDDIFEISQEDVSLNKRVMLCKHNSYYSNREVCVTERQMNSAVMASCEENLLLLIHETPNDRRNRHSLDIFSSPDPVTCKSPAVFEDTLLIDSHLGHLLDKPQVKCLDSSVDSEKRDCNRTFNIDALKSQKNAKGRVTSPNFLAVTELVDHTLSKQITSNETYIDKEEKSSSGYADESELLLDNDKQHTLSLNTVHRHCAMDNIKGINKQKKSAGVLSSGIDDITESFLKQAFTTDFDFENSSNRSKKFVDECNQSIGETLPPQEMFRAKLAENILSEKFKDQNVLGSSENVKLPQSVGSSNQTRSLKPHHDKFETPRSVKMKLTFVDNFEEEEEYLVPSSQSMSDSSSHNSSSYSNVTRKKNQKETSSSPLKRKRNKGRKELKIKEYNAMDSVSKKLKIRSNAAWDSLNVIDVCTERNIFNGFTEKLKSCSHVAFSVACERYSKEAPKQYIGDKILGRRPTKVENEKKILVDNDCCVVGIGVCLGDENAYYIALDTSSKGDASQRSVSFSEQLNLVEQLLAQEENYFLSAFDMKEQYKVLYHSCSISIDKEICDPKVAEWMLNAECVEEGLRPLMIKYIPNSLKLLKRIGNVTGRRSLGLHFKSSVRARMRASLEAVITWHLVSIQLKKLEECNLLKVYKEVEMPTMLCLARMEVHGIGFCRNEAEKLHFVLQRQLKDLEQEAFKLAHHSFSLSSPNEVSKVLFKELQLKPRKVTSNYKSSTNKNVLIKLKNDHPLPSVILEWRKISFIMTKIILPFLRVEISDRVYGSHVTDTVTGRISMYEPNLQSIPRNFDISIRGEKMTISMRVAFVPKSGKSFVSGDYAQLELRLLAHLSQDKILLNILKNGADVFKSVAATWNGIGEEEVTDVLRQRAKQVCYGIIYGIGPNTLSEQLEVEEDDAALFMEAFLNAYPGLKMYRQSIIQKCKKQGFVETLSGRKRFLPLINSNKPHLRAQAERQAVNTTIQGSAADIAKTGMVLVEASLKAAFRNESPKIRRLRENKRQCIETSTATLVLHLHDELMYEVCDKYVSEVIRIIKGGMEAAADLSVPLPVKIKVGKSWGMLKEVL